MRLAFIGNCQVQTLAVAASLLLDQPHIRVFDYSEAYSRDAEGRRQFAESLGDCDYIFVQTADFSSTGEKDLEPAYGEKVIRIANFYFRGLFPDSCYVGDFSSRLDKPMLVNSLIVLDAFRRQLSETAALREFNIESFARLGILDAWSSSMAEMRRREANAAIDVPAADLMEDACRRYPAFLTMNHPSAALLTDYLGQVFGFAGISCRYSNILAVPDPLSQHDTTPILDEVAEHFDLPYRTSQRWRINSMHHRFASREDYVAAFYQSYRRAQPSHLLAHSPTDMVAALRGNAALAYLVDADAPVPDTISGAAGSADAASLVPEEPPEQPMLARIVEIQSCTHRIHSYLEVIDPKVERIVQTLDTGMAHGSRCRGFPSSGRRWQTLLAGALAALLAALVAGYVAGSVIAGFGQGRPA